MRGELTAKLKSTAIIQYLIEKYDTGGRLTYTTGPEKYLVSQWLMFQASGQGVYFGQGEKIRFNAGCY